MGELDIAAKALLLEAPEAVVALALGPVELRSASAGPTELPATARRADKLIRYEVASSAEPRWLHVEIQAVPSSMMPRRMFVYWARVFAHHQPLRSLLVCLRPGKKQAHPRRPFVVRDETGVELLRFTYTVVCLWEVDREALAAAGVPALLTLVPFAKGAKREDVEQVIETLQRVETLERRVELLAVLGVFAGRVFPEVDWLARIPEVTLMQSRTMQSLKRKFELSGGQKLLASMLRMRLGEAEASPLIARLMAGDEALLKQVSGLVVASSTEAELAIELDRILPARA